MLKFSQNRPPLGLRLVELSVVAGTLLALAEGLAGLSAAPWPLRKALLLLLALFDLGFSLEFAIRWGQAIAAGFSRDYLLGQEGWLEGLASLPLLAFISGPLLLSALFLDGRASALDGLGRASLFLPEALGSLGILRLLRLLRLGGIGPGWEALRRPLLALLLSLFFLGLGLDLSRTAGLWPGLEEGLAEKRLASMALLSAEPGADGAEAAALRDGELVLVRSEGRVLYTRHPARSYPRLFGPRDLGYLRLGGLEAYFSLAAERRAKAGSAFAALLGALAAASALLLALRPSPPRS